MAADRCVQSVDAWLQKAKVDEEFAKLEQEISHLREACTDVASQQRTTASKAKSLSASLMNAMQYSHESTTKMAATECRNKQLEWANFELTRENAALRAEVEALRHRQAKCHCFPKLSPVPELITTPSDSENEGKSSIPKAASALR